MRFVFPVIVVVIIAAGLYFAFQKYCGGIYVEKNHSETYSCQDGKIISAQFFSTSDHMLLFAKVVMPGGREYSLPLMPSASGSRYSDEFTLEAWFKGDELIINKPSEDREMKLAYECKVR